MDELLTGNNIITQMEGKAKNDLINRILEYASTYLKGSQLMELNKTLNIAFEDYEIFVDNRIDENRNYKLENQAILQRFISTKEVEGLSPRTIIYYQTTMQKFLDSIDCHLSDVDAQIIREYLSKKQKRNDCSNATLDNVRRIFSTFFSFCNDEGFVQRNPMRKVKKIKSVKQVKRAYTDIEIEQMRDYLAKMPDKTKLQEYLKARDTAIFELLLSSGIRIMECVNLNKEDIDLQNRTFKVLGKGNKERMCYFSARAEYNLRKLLKAKPPKKMKNNPALFLGTNGRVGINGVERRIREMGQNLGIEAHPHKFRRTFATNLMKREVPVEQIQELMGHSNMDTTMIYAIVDQEQVKINHSKYAG